MFDPDKFLQETAPQQPSQVAGGFDPDQFLKDTAPKVEGSQLQAGLESVGQGASFGYLPQLQAIAEPVTDFIGDTFGSRDEVDESLEAQGFDVQENEQDYTQRRDANIERQTAQKKEFPKTALGGEILGGVLTGIATAGLGPQLKGASLASKLGQAAKSGAAYGAIQNPGDVKNKVQAVQLFDRLENALTGAVTGALVQGTMSGVGKLARGMKKAPKRIKDLAGDQAISAAGGERGSIKKVFRENRIDLKEAGNDLLEKHEFLGGKAIIEAGDDIGDIGKKISKTLEHNGNNISTITQETDALLTQLKTRNLTPRQTQMIKSVNIDMKVFAEGMKKQFKKTVKGVDKRATLNKLEKALDELAEGAEDISLDELRALRRSIDDKISWNKSNIELTPIQDGFLQMRRKIQDITKQRIKTADKIAGTNNLKAFEKANRDYTKLKVLDEFAQNRQASEMGNKFFSMSEGFAGGAGATFGGPVGFLAGVMASRSAKKWGGAVAARALKKTSELLAKDPAKLGKFTGEIAKAYKRHPDEAIRIIVDLQQGSPEFRRLLKDE